MIDQTAPRAGKELPETKAPKNDPTNVQRLRAHLKPDSLACALLDAWEAADPQERGQRLHGALQEFSARKQADDGAAKT